jgi:CHAT domain-containing protein
MGIRRPERERKVWGNSAAKFIGLLGIAAWLMVAAGAIALEWPTKQPQTEAEMQAWSDLVEARRQAIEQALRQKQLARALSEAEELVAFVDRSQHKGATARIVARELAGRAAMLAQDPPRMKVHFLALVAEAEAAGMGQDGGLFIPCWALGEVYYLQEEFAASQRWLIRAHGLAAKANPPPHTRVAVLARLFEATAKTQMEAAPLEGLLQQRRELLKLWPDAPWTVLAAVEVDAATVALLRLNLRQAEELAVRGLAIAEKGHAFAPSAGEVAKCANVLATSRNLAGDHAGAEVAARRALQLIELQEGPTSPALVGYLNGLAAILRHLGRGAEARQLLERAEKLAQDGRAGAAMHSILLSSLAELRHESGDHQGAVQLRRRIVELRKAHFGPQHLAVAIAQGELGQSLMEADLLPEAEVQLAAYLHAIERKEGPNSMMADRVLLDLCRVARLQGAAARAEPLCQRADTLVKRQLGPWSGRRAAIGVTLAMCALDLGQPQRAVALLQEALAVREKEIARLMFSGTEDDRHQLLRGATSDLSDALALALDSAVGDPAAAELALETVLQRKGRLFDVLADQRRRIKALPPALQEKVSHVALMRGRIAARGMQHLPADATAVAELEAAEREVSRELAGTGAEAGGPLLPAVRAALPAKGVLVEYALWRPWFREDGKVPKVHGSLGRERLAVALLRKAGPVQWLDLGPSARTDGEIDRWRAALMDPRSANVDEIGRQLDTLVWQPVRKRLGPGELPLVAPDGLLHLVPFGALVDEKGRYAVETQEIVRLSAGRDLLRMAPAPQPAHNVWIFANPAFDGGLVESKGVSAAGRRATNAGSLHFAPLPGAEAEGRAVAAQWPGSRLLLGPQATESALLQAAGPGVLHLATHGFFLTGGEWTENPLLRSGLAMAGSNHRSKSGDDGLLTALEVGALDLGATQLVVLSACETGVGRVRSGDGPQGLQRAFAAAGARTVVMSLWQVDDAATRDLMVGYYQSLRRGQSRAVALRQAALTVAKGGVAVGKPLTAAGQRGAEALGAPVEQAQRRLRHPYYWASFQSVGDWRPLALGPAVR